MPFVMSVRITAPMITPNTFPRPPLNEMLPIAAAAIACCANSAPIAGSAQLSRDVNDARDAGGQPKACRR